MSRRTYSGALDRLLKPLGFSRDKRNWTRVRGDIWDCVNLQKSWSDGAVTVNLYGKDLETERILKSIPCECGLGIVLLGQRIGSLIDGHDRWWKNNPDGPGELAEAVRLHALPWFDRIQSLEDQADLWYGRAAVDPWRTPNIAAKAITLHRLGETDKVLAMFQEPLPRTAREGLVTSGRCVERWLRDRTNAVNL